MSDNKINRDESLMTICASISNIKVLPQVVYKIMEATESKGGSALELENQIKVDPGFTARLLSQANSSFYALPKRVSSIREAVMLLGFTEIREMAMKASVFDFFVGKSDKESMRRRDWWKLSVDTASICNLIGQNIPGVNPNEAYTAGLLHYLGKTFIDQHDPTAYDKVMYVVERGAPERLAERILFAVDHVDVAQEMARRWSFSDSLIGALNYDDDPSTEIPASPVRAMVGVSHLLALYCGLPFEEVKSKFVKYEWALEEIGLSMDACPELLMAAAKRLDERRAA